MKKTDILKQMLSIFPCGYRIYRRNSLLIEHNGFDILVQLAILEKKQASFCLYTYDNGKFLYSPIFFDIPVSDIDSLFESLKKLLSSNNQHEFIAELNALKQTEVKNIFLSVNFSDYGKIF